MKWGLLLIALLMASAFMASAFAEDELKVYGIVTYLARDNHWLRLGDIEVVLLDSDVEGVLTVGSLVEVEGFWQLQTFYAEEVEVEHPQAEVLIYQGQVQGGKLLGLEFPGFTEGEWLEVVAERHDENLNVLLIRSVAEGQSKLQAVVETLTNTGFVAGGVRVISARDVGVGQSIILAGRWNGQALVETASPSPQ
jgi:hypothetical protein